MSALDRFPFASHPAVDSEQFRGKAGKVAGHQSVVLEKDENIANPCLIVLSHGCRRRENVIWS